MLISLSFYVSFGRFKLAQTALKILKCNSNLVSKTIFVFLFVGKKNVYFN